MSRFRLLLWRLQRPLAVAYVALLCGAAAAIWFYHTRVPASLDTGMTVAVRSWFHEATFRDVERAKSELALAATTVDVAERDQLREFARQRLEAYLAMQRTVQPDRLHTQAVVEATETLADLHRSEGRTSRAARLLTDLAKRIPLNYHLRWAAGRALRDAGDLVGATAAFREAFKLAINHAELAEDYLEMLSEQNAFEDILWVARMFASGSRAGRPSVELKVGVARSAMQRAVLDWSGIPVEHGSYTRAVTRFGLRRGTECVVDVPRDMFDDWSDPGRLFVQARFENVYDGVRVRAMRYTTRDGRAHELVLDAENSSVFHRPHSGVEAYVEIRPGIEAAEVSTIELVYSCDEQELSDRALAIIERARRNMGQDR
ncbi:MAG: hypothetical protein KDB80_08285 [Planctomycetes bacterium]|nr:hypothetical protein [Planctomycetota bacterium]